MTKRAAFFQPLVGARAIKKTTELIAKRKNSGL